MYKSLQRKPTLPRQAFNSPNRNGAVSSDARLSIIAEDGVPLPRPPPNPHHRPFSRRWNLGDPPRHSFEVPPPKYALWDVPEAKGDKLDDVRNNKHIAKRGGWRRTCLILLILIAAVIALVVGLVVGLRHRAKKSSIATSATPSDSSSTSTPLPTGPFPQGVYSSETFLANVSTNCVSQSSDWQCPPYHTYTESPAAAMLTFQWITTATNNDTSNLTISSSNNPFSFAFASAPLTLVDAGQDSERYIFNTTFDKIVVSSLGVHCFFNNTLFEASLYTKRPKSYPPPESNRSTPVATTTAAAPLGVPLSSPSPSPIPPFADWEYAVDVKHSHDGGPTVPECYKMDNGVRGARVIDGRTSSKSSRDSDSSCSCIYRNHDP